MRIGFIGLAGAGKDTAANLCLETLKGSGFTIDRFAGPLKRAAERVFGEHFDDRDVKEVPVPVTGDLYERMVDAGFLCAVELFGENEDLLDKSSDAFCKTFLKFDHGYENLDEPELISPRVFQQLLGTDVMRSVQDSCFRDRFIGKDRLLVPDCRFQNELDVLDAAFLIFNQDIVPVAKHISEEFAADLTEDYLDCRDLPPKIIAVENPIGDLNKFQCRLMAQLTKFNITKV